jgi:subfamily B ATP-binding cassette protein MsbA
MGTHEELLLQSGTYRRLYDLQFSNDESSSAGTKEVVTAELEGTA